MNYFSDIISSLQGFWKTNGCSIIQGTDNQVGAGTLATFTAINIVKYQKYNVCYAQYCRRQTDGRFAKNPNRLSSYYQMQVILKPTPENIQELCIKSMEAIGLDVKNGEIKFLEDDWKNPSIGASGVGYEMWYNGMEVLQFTFMQKIGGIALNEVPCELTYGLERVAMYIQNANSIFDIKWDKDLMYKDIHPIQYEEDMCHYYQNFHEDDDFVVKTFYEHLKNAENLIKLEKFYAGYEQCLSASNYLNIVDARGLISQNKRQEMILQIRDLVKLVIVHFNENTKSA